VQMLEHLEAQRQKHAKKSDSLRRRYDAEQEKGLKRISREIVKGPTLKRKKGFKHKFGVHRRSRIRTEAADSVVPTPAFRKEESASVSPQGKGTPESAANG